MERVTEVQVTTHDDRYLRGELTITPYTVPVSQSDNVLSEIVGVKVYPCRNNPIRIVTSDFKERQLIMTDNTPCYKRYPHVLVSPCNILTNIVAHNDNNEIYIATRHMLYRFNLKDSGDYKLEWSTVYPSDRAVIKMVSCPKLDHMLLHDGSQALWLDKRNGDITYTVPSEKGVDKIVDVHIDCGDTGYVEFQNDLVHFVKAVAYNSSRVVDTVPARLVEIFKTALC